MNDKPERKISGVTVIIDRNTCIGTANCTKVAPEVLILDDEKIVTFQEKYPEIERERIIEACSVCPVDALHVIDETGKEIVP